MIDNQKNEMLKSLRGFAKMSLDFSFKRVFGNESNKGALIAFLNRVIDGVDIEDVQLLPTERLGLTSSDRKAVFDVFCRGKDGTEFIVEMQCAKQKYFKERALYYAGYPLVEQGRSAF
jgi:predicted transposase/invertase (TIGR01784 family)